MGIHANTDGQSRSSQATTVKPAAYTSDVTGETINLGGYNTNAITIAAGTITDGTHTPKVQHSPDDSVWTDVVPADDLIGPALVAITTDSVQQVAYRGVNQYIRVFVTVATATTGGVYSATVKRGKPGLAGELTNPIT